MQGRVKISLRAWDIRTRGKIGPFPGFRWASRKNIPLPVQLVTMTDRDALRDFAHNQYRHRQAEAVEHRVLYLRRTRVGGQKRCPSSPFRNCRNLT